MRNQTLMSRQLEYFFTLYRLKDYSAAANAIPISYQGLRKSISKLEAEMGVTLFVGGDGGGLEPTPAADALYEHTLKWSEDIDNLDKAIHTQGGNKVRSLHVCASIGVLNSLGYELFFKFDDAYPNIRLNITELTDTGTDESLLRGEFGIGFTVSPFDEELVTTPLLSQPSAAWVNKNHPLASKTALALRDLADENVMMPNVQYKEARYLLSLLNDKGIHLASKRFSSDPTWSMAFAAAGKGIGLTPANVYGYSKSPKDVVLLPLVDGYTRTMGLSHRRGHILSADERCFRNYIVEYVRNSRQ